ncbi:MAG: FimV/HubP family polar landmark protein [Pseudomonadota bacterium]
MPSKMHPYTRPTLVSFGLKTLSAAVTSAVLLLSSAHAAGLGKLTVLSSLGQPLRAEIELTSVAKDEASALVAKLASTDAFRVANIEFNPALLSLRFAIEQKGGRSILRVTSAQAMNEPYVDMLLELSSGNNRLVREYTFLLDPAELQTSQSAQITAPVDVPAVTTAQVTTTQVAATPVADGSSAISGKKQKKRGASKTASDAAVDGGDAPKATEKIKSSESSGEITDYKVKAGDTLGSIAGRLKPNGVSLDQMLVALYLTNQSSFIGDNMNRLRSGEVLTVPDTETIRGASDADDAKDIVKAQSSNFSNYRNKLAGQVITAVPSKAVESKQNAGGKITTKVEEKSTAANESKDKLKLSSKANAGATAASSQKAAPVVPEDKIAKDKASAEAAARVKELEKNVGDLKKVLDIKHKGLADQQKALDEKAAASSKIASVPAPTTTTTVAATPAPTSAVVPTPTPAIEPKPAPVVATAASTPIVVAPAATSSATIASVEPIPPVATSPVVEPPPAVVVKPMVPPQPAAAPEIGLVDTILDSPYLVPGGVAAVLVLGALAFLGMRRKKKPQHSDSSILSDSSMQVNSLFGSTGGQSVDTNNSVFNSNFAPSASQLDTNEVDPVAEADVYIAYGRDAQAEEILKEALRTQPERHAVRVKLLEIYANRKDTRSFEILAGELYGMTKGEGDDWAQVASLGIGIDPNNPLYAGGELSADAAARAPSLTALTEPLQELDPETLLDNTPEVHHAALNVSQYEKPVLAPAAMANRAAATASAMDETLDFDLGDLGDFSTEPEVVHPVSLAKVAEPRTLDFDMGGLSAAPAPVAVVVPAVMEFDAPTLPDLKIADIKVDQKVEVATVPDELDFDLGGLGFETSAPHEVKHVQVPVDIKVDFGGMELDHISASPVNEHAFTVDPAVALAEVSPAYAHQASESQALDLGLSGINLDLHAPASDLNANNNGDIALDINGDVSMEMDTKLDLAIAYQEIGDKEGARELVDEVIKGGSGAQIEKAKEMRRQLA